MGQWSEEDLLISVDLDGGSNCNSAYGWPSNMRVAADKGFDAKDCRFRSFAAGGIAAGRWVLFTIAGYLRLAPAWRSLACI